jgi:hypothetical protein
MGTTMTNINKQQPTKNTWAQWRRKRRGGATWGECRGSAFYQGVNKLNKI